ncbi:MAG: phosphate ABC transporter substrate-binding protein [Stenomitos frigidus ULC029]
MAKGNNDTAALIIAFLVTAGLLVGGGVWFFKGKLFRPLDGTSDPTARSSATPQNSTNPTTVPALETSQPNPAVLTMDGSVTMVALMKQFQLAYTQVNPSLQTTYGLPDGNPNGTNTGIRNLIDGKALITASSRPLKPNEYQAGLQAIPIAKDALAVVVGLNNPYKGGLTSQQLKQIFQGKITNWSQVGGPALPIKVINRSSDSGTYTFFKDVVLFEQSFAPDGPNFTTARQDETTPLLQQLGRNGITYSTVQQVEKQRTVRIVPIDGLLPTDQTAIQNGTYPLGRVLYLAVPKQISPAVKQFIDMTLSPRGQQVVQRVGFLPL